MSIKTNRTFCWSKYFVAMVLSVFSVEAFSFAKDASESPQSLRYVLDTEIEYSGATLPLEIAIYEGQGEFNGQTILDLTLRLPGGDGQEIYSKITLGPVVVEKFSYHRLVGSQELFKKRTGIKKINSRLQFEELEQHLVGIRVKSALNESLYDLIYGHLDSFFLNLEWSQFVGDRDLTTLSTLEQRYQKLLKTLPQTVVGQDHAKRVLLGRVLRKIKGVNALNWVEPILLLGATGNGRKYLPESIFKALELPYVVIKMASYTTNSDREFLSDVRKALGGDPSINFIFDRIDQAPPAVQRALANLIKEGFVFQEKGIGFAKPTSIAPVSPPIVIATTSLGKGIVSPQYRVTSRMGFKPDESWSVVQYPFHPVKVRSLLEGQEVIPQLIERFSSIVPIYDPNRKEFVQAYFNQAQSMVNHYNLQHQTEFYVDFENLKEIIEPLFVDGLTYKEINIMVSSYVQTALANTAMLYELKKGAKVPITLAASFCSVLMQGR